MKNLFIIALLVSSCSAAPKPVVEQPKPAVQQPVKTTSNVCCISSGITCEYADEMKLGEQCFCPNYQTYSGAYIGYACKQ